MVVHQLIPSSFSQTGSCQWNSGTRNPQNPNFQNYLSLLITPEDASPSNQESTQKQQTCTSNISPATVTNDKSLDAIFLFKLKELSIMPLFSGAALEEKPITAMYTDAKIDGHHIKLILDSGSASSIITRQLIDLLGRRVDRATSVRIIMADGATKTPIGKIDDLPIKINGIIVPIKVLVMEATQYQTLVGNDWLFKTNATLDWNTQELQFSQNRQEKWDSQPCLTCGKTLLDEEMWNDILRRGRTCDVFCQYTILISNWVKKRTPIEATGRRAVQQLDSCPYDNDELWQMAIAKIKDALPEKIRTIKNNPPKPIKLD
ncbi:hypothetical protein G9A89_000960 [Geosiphon pyriformis]|nr:hypothetical protein G9A89_000960 [Geosiphon pyriformis]